VPGVPRQGLGLAMVGWAGSTAVLTRCYWTAGRAMDTRRGDARDAALATAPVRGDGQAENIAARRGAGTFQRIRAAAARGLGTPHRR
jgi:hypothetical protein